MFHPIPAPIFDRMRHLEDIDARDRVDGTPQLRRLRQVPPETGRFLALLAASAPQGTWIEIGTSAGYSALWLALACRAADRRLTTFEIDEAKAALAEETFAQGGVTDVVDLVRGDALEHLGSGAPVAFCFLDAEKDLYEACYDALVPRLTRGGLLVADNIISHRDALQPLVNRALADPRVDAVVVPIGTGELVCRKVN